MSSRFVFEILKLSYRGDLKRLKEYHKRGVDFNVSNNLGFSPAHLASAGGHVAVLRFFYSIGLDLNKSDNKCETPAHSASFQGHVAVLRFFHSIGFDLNKSSKAGRTPAHWASQGGHVAVLEYLFEKGLKLDDQELTHNFTPAMLAASKDQQKCVEFLLRHDIAKKECLWKMEDLSKEMKAFLKTYRTEKEIAQERAEHERKKLEKTRLAAENERKEYEKAKLAAAENRRALLAELDEEEKK